MKRGFKKEQGSALLIVMVVISVIATLSLTIIQLALMSSRSVLRTEDGMNAQIVAMAGIEDGLLRWKFDRNVEAPAKNDQIRECSSSPYEESDRFDRVILGLESESEDTVQSCILRTSAPSPNEMVYDIKVSHRLKQGVSECVRGSGVDAPVIAPNCPSAPGDNNFALRQDQTIEYGVADLASITLNWRFNNSYPNPSNVILEVVSLGDSCASQDKICNKETYNLSDSGNPQIFTVGLGERLRIKVLGASLDYYNLSAPSNSLDTRFTTMDVTGYYGGVQRRLRLKLDRLTGQALPIYDFALFSGGGGIENSQP